MHRRFTEHSVYAALCTLFHLILTNHPSLSYCYFHFDHRGNCNPEKLLNLQQRYQDCCSPQGLCFTSTWNHSLQSSRAVFAPFPQASVLTSEDQRGLHCLSYTRVPSFHLAFSIPFTLLFYSTYHHLTYSLYLFNIFIVFLPPPLNQDTISMREGTVSVLSTAVSLATRIEPGSGQTLIKCLLNE